MNTKKTNGGGNSAGALIAIVLLLVVVALFVIYGLPYLGGGRTGGANVNLPSSVNVNTK